MERKRLFCKGMRTHHQQQTAQAPTAEGFGITVLADDLYVNRSQQMKKTFITATYEIHINFWPFGTYVWLVREEVVGYYL